MSNKFITIRTSVKTTIEKVWECWTAPEDIMQWCHASDDWHAPAATNDLKVGGTFSTTMAAKDGSFSFDFNGVYTSVVLHKHIAYTMGDGRKAQIDFISTAEGVDIIESFEPENMNSLEMQQAGWQAILDNFRKHAEQ